MRIPVFGIWFSLILAVSENGYGKCTDVDRCRLQSRGGKGVINMRAIPKVGKVTVINLIDETCELMIISQFGKIIRIDTKSIRAPAAAPGCQLLDLKRHGKVVAAGLIPQKEPKPNPKRVSSCGS